MTPGAFVESALFAGLGEDDIKEWNMLARVRYAVYRPGGPMAMELSKNPTVLIVNDTAFVHGGLTPVHGELPPPLMFHNEPHLNWELHIPPTAIPCVVISESCFDGLRASYHLPVSCLCSELRVGEDECRGVLMDAG